MKTLQSQQGFTLVELIMVIVILGILAAVAVPKFIDLGSDARISMVNSMAGTIRSAANMAYASGQVRGIDEAGNTELADKTEVAMVNGYPAATALGIGILIAEAGDFTPAAGEGMFLFTHKKAKDADTCRVEYTAATATAPPKVEAKTGGC